MERFPRNGSGLLLCRRRADTIFGRSAGILDTSGFGKSETDTSLYAGKLDSRIVKFCGEFRMLGAAALSEMARKKEIRTLQSPI